MPYPLLLAPILMEEVWGGRRLEQLGKRLAPGAAAPAVRPAWTTTSAAENRPQGESSVR